MTVKVLVVDNPRAFRDRMDRNYLGKHQALATDPRFTCVDLKAAGQALRDHSYDGLLLGVFSSPLHPLAPPGTELSAELLARVPVRALLVEDLRDRTFVGGYTAVARFLDEHDVHLITTYQNESLDQVLRRCIQPHEVEVVSHHIDTTIFHPADTEIGWDILLYGNIDRPWYPFRQRLWELLPRMLSNVHVVPHPTYERFDPHRCGAGLARLIRRAKIAVATASSEDYLVAKFFEISACGTVLAAQMATSGERIWGRSEDESYVALRPQMSDEQIVDRLRHAIAEWPRLRQVALRVAARIADDYSLDRFPDRVAQLFGRWSGR